jgi:hypothetical protein
VNELKGKCLQNIYRSADKKFLRFELLEGDMFYIASGDCCSECWFESIIYPCKDDYWSCWIITDVISIPMNANQDGLIIYGYKLKTRVGDIHIEYRNSYDGYAYRGECNMARWDTIKEYINEDLKEWE